MLGMTQMKVQDLETTGLPDTGHFLHTGADVSWELFSAQPEQLCAVALYMQSLFWGHGPGGKTHVHIATELGLNGYSYSIVVLVVRK